MDEPEPEVQPRTTEAGDEEEEQKNKMSMAAPTDVLDGAPDEAIERQESYDGDLDDAFDGEGGGGAPVAKPKPVVVEEEGCRAARVPAGVGARAHDATGGDCAPRQ
jgi:hypothetical protein